MTSTTTNAVLFSRQGTRGTDRALGEEEKWATEDTPSTPKAETRAPLRGAHRIPLPYATARAYAARFGLAYARECAIKAHRLPEWCKWTRRFIGGGSWQHFARSIESWEIAAALANGSDRVAARSMSRVRHLVIDVDVHGEPPPFSREKGASEESIDDYLDPRRVRRAQREGARRAREWRASVARPVIDRLVALGVVDAVCSSPRGYHVVVMLRESVEPAEAARLAREIGSRVGELPEGVNVESYPRLRSDGRADHCALPLVGPSRWVREDLATPRSRLRADDVRDLLALPGRTPEEVRARLAARPAEPEIARVQDAHTEKARAEPVNGQLLGADYVTEVLQLIQGGMPMGASYDAVRRVTAAARYCGLADDEARGAIERWIELPIHRANHAQTRSGRAQLRSLVRSQLRHFARGATAGRCYAGGLRSRELRDAFAGLVAESDARDGKRERDRLVWLPARNKIENVVVVMPPTRDRVLARDHQAPKVRDLEGSAALGRRSLALVMHGSSLLSGSTLARAEPRDEHERPRGAPTPRAEASTSPAYEAGRRDPGIERGRAASSREKEAGRRTRNSASTRRAAGGESSSDSAARGAAPESSRDRLGARRVSNPIAPPPEAAR